MIKGKVWKFGDNINTDDIIAARYLNTTDEKQLASHCLETIMPDFAHKVQKGDIIVAGNNFGCGSSREHAPISIKGCGVSVVIAKSFARIFLRNSINIGLPVIELSEADNIEQGDVLEIDFENGIIKNITKNTSYTFPKYPEFLQDIIKNGGLIQWVKARYIK
ncbi:MAG: 3-isopropylmalate dehydratase small subunit [Candidatus Omnitrophica bacterium]|nr:3-isopropylmalate dehydratase small subunit [Candidatus Omnitrophota bacterium]MCM8777953.1 3-isopropylmalate dehydratase small subunit [Candidatus Omnitrophota bacterium]